MTEVSSYVCSRQVSNRAMKPSPKFAQRGALMGTFDSTKAGQQLVHTCSLHNHSTCRSFMLTLCIEVMWLGANVYHVGSESVCGMARQALAHRAMQRDSGIHAAF